MANKEGKNHSYGEWEIRFLREGVFMPFGSLCNLLGQAYQGKGITPETLEKLAKKAFEIARELTEDAIDYSKEKKVEDSNKIEFPEKN
ncbi:MAG: hypothetical protein DDT18_01159 [Actinobacteria bacterium]|nr:hypothetical protein [Actinomycetota bacterium]